MKQWLISVANEVYDAYEWKDNKQISIFNKTCTPQIRRRIHYFKWLWDGRFQCDDFVGESSRQLTREEALKHALEDYFKKSGQTDSITNQQIEQMG